DTRNQLLKNFDMFREKWGNELTAGYHLPGPSGSAPDQAVQSPEPADTPAVVEENQPETDQGDANLVAIESSKNEIAGQIVLSDAERPKVSLCMIVKNEEARLGACLDSAADLFDEVVINDTGSTDRTREVARRYGVRLVEVPWPNSF